MFTLEIIIKIKNKKSLVRIYQKALAAFHDQYLLKLKLFVLHPNTNSLPLIICITAQNNSNVSHCNYMINLTFPTVSIFIEKV